MANYPFYLSLLFGLTVVGVILWFYFSSRSRLFLIMAMSWAVIQSILGLTGFYQNTYTIPPRLFLFGIFPPLLGILVLMNSLKGKEWMNRINLRTLTFLHTLRIPIEIVLILLYYNDAISRYMTFEGTNFDILSGLSAPLIGYLAFQRETHRKNLLMIWNILCLILLFNVVITAALALPSPIQKISFEQPNMAVLYFPFNLLPTVVVPIVFFSHLIAIRTLRK